jgi:hypothetical protein
MHDSGIWNEVTSNILQCLMTIVNKLLETYLKQYIFNNILQMWIKYHHTPYSII